MLCYLGRHQDRQRSSTEFQRFRSRVSNKISSLETGRRIVIEITLKNERIDAPYVKEDRSYRSSDQSS
ncbi:hypothetical protein DAI22_06g219800 [Oryza sativa Japonica Group]|nr:hypothetical protein DAI22_06g219800 [Oryza sativa Japonica Group]